MRGRRCLCLWTTKGTRFRVTHTLRSDSWYTLMLSQLGCPMFPVVMRVKSRVKEEHEHEHAAEIRRTPTVVSANDTQWKAHLHQQAALEALHPTKDALARAEPSQSSVVAAQTRKSTTHDCCFPPPTWIADEDSHGPPLLTPPAPRTAATSTTTLRWTSSSLNFLRPR